MHSTQPETTSSRVVRATRQPTLSPSCLNRGGHSAAGSPFHLRLRDLLIAGSLYLACLLIAVFPYPLGFIRNLPSAGDPSQHLWIMDTLVIHDGEAGDREGEDLSQFWESELEPLLAVAGSLGEQEGASDATRRAVIPTN